MTAPQLNTAPHDITEACAGAHCYSHDIDEPADRCYIACFECGHIYRSAAELWWAHLRKVLSIAGRDLRHPLDGPSWVEPRIPWWQQGRTAAALMVLHALIEPARRISFCQHCIHDF